MGGIGEGSIWCWPIEKVHSVQPYFAMVIQDLLALRWSAVSTIESLGMQKRILKAIVILVIHTRT